MANLREAEGGLFGLADFEQPPWALDAAEGEDDNRDGDIDVEERWDDPLELRVAAVYEGTRGGSSGRGGAGAWGYLVMR